VVASKVMNMSKSESSAGENKKLMLRVKTLEAQLKQSIPKKDHEQEIEQMQASLDKTAEELERTKSELAKLSDLGERIRTLSETLAAQGKVISQQNKAIESLSRKLADGTVPVHVHEQTLSKVREYEERLVSMVPKDDFVTLQKNYEEINERFRKLSETTVPIHIHEKSLSKLREYEERLASMVSKEEFISLQKKYEEVVERLNYTVPKSDYEALQEKTAELERKISNMVPKEELAAAEAKVQQLENRMAYYVPKADYDELASKIVALAEEATSAPNFADTTEDENESEQQSTDVEVTPQQTFEEVFKVAAPSVSVETFVSSPRESDQPPTQEVIAATQDSATETPTTMQPISTPQDIPSAGPAQVPVAQPQESQTSESSNSESKQPVENQPWFRFENTDLCAKTPMEFLEDIEKVPLESILVHNERGDFERWFREYVADHEAAESLRSIRESNFSGEELRNRIISVVSGRYSSPTPTS
jgi:hypothetical protein